MKLIKLIVLNWLHQWRKQRVQTNPLRKVISPILFLPFFLGFSQNVFAEKVELECRVYNLYLKKTEPSTEPTISKYIFDASTEKLIEIDEIYTDQNGVVRGRANTFKTELASPSLVVATLRDPDGGLKRVRIDRTNMEIQEVYYFPPYIKGAEPVYHKGSCSITKALDPKF